MRKNADNKICISTVVAGLDKGVGATHFSILLANYYGEVLGKNTAIIDINKDNDYSYMGEVCSGKCTAEIFKVRNITFYPSVNMSKLAEIYNSNYNSIIIDIGCNYRKLRNEISMCDKKYLIGTASMWRLRETISRYEIVNEYVGEQQWKYLYSFGDKQTAETIECTMGIQLHNIPYINNPFKVNGKQLDMLRKLLMD
jgi:hypothetical protein